MKLLNPFDWYPCDTWNWPDDDRKLMQVNHWVDDVDRFLALGGLRGVAVQAGGACGIWPARLAGYFEQVITFEPCAANFECLQANCEPFANIRAINAALGRAPCRMRLARDAFEDGNAGAWYLAAGDDVEVMTIDSLALDACDLIMLDVEGFELEALIGAEQTISRFRPMIVLEQKQLPHMAGDARDAGRWLESRGYSARMQSHNDVVYQC